MPILRAESVNHVSIPVNDVERAKKFYVEMLGMKELPREGGGERRPGDPPISVGEVMGLPRTPSPCRLECGGLEVTLFERPKPIEFDTFGEQGSFHYSFRMSWDDLDRLASDIEGLRRAGYTIPCEPIYRNRGTPTEGMSLYVLDPEGNLFELVSRVPGRAYRTPSSQPLSV